MDADGQEGPEAHAGHPAEADGPDTLREAPLTGRRTELASCHDSALLEMTANATPARLVGKTGASLMTAPWPVAGDNKS